MIPFEMVVLYKLVHRTPKMALAQWNDPIEAFFFDRSHKSLGVRIRVWCPIRRLDDADPAFCKISRTGPRHFASLAQIRTRQVSMSAMVSERPAWRIKASSGNGVDPRICTRRDARWITNTV
jgi:hypothetical protein